MKCSDSESQHTGVCETQVWGVPWSEDDFIQQMVKFRHPATLQSCLPDVLKETVAKCQTMDAQQRMSYRAGRLGFWLKRFASLRSEEQPLKSEMDSEAGAILGGNNILLWEAMLQAVDYPDLGEVDEFKQGSELVGCVDRMGLWLSQFCTA